ncbi:MAG: hypothetical protein ACR2N7_02460 [Acidimicrobiia bacterium]
MLAPTTDGRLAIEGIRPGQAAFSARLIESFGRAEFEALISELERMSTAVDVVGP